MRRGFGIVWWVVLAFACDDPERPASPPAEPVVEPPPPAEAREVTVERWDPREAVARPEAHVGEERTCHVAFTERLTDVHGRERTRYTIAVVRRVAVQCATEGVRSWADLVFTEERKDEAARVTPGTVARVRVVSPDRGFAGYPVLELLAIGGTADLPAAPAEPETPPPGFDFGRAGDPGVARSSRRCAVDFAGRLEIVDDRTRARHGYPEETSHRVALKCIHASGDAWVDLVLAPAASMRALAIGRGDTLEVRILSPDGGHADRPVVTPVSGTPSAVPP